MGLDDVVDTGEDEDVEDIPESLEDFDGDLDEYLQRLKSLSAVMANIDGRIEDIQKDINQLDSRVKRVEATYGEVTPDGLASAFTREELESALEQLPEEDTEEDTDSLWDST